MVQRYSRMPQHSHNPLQSSNLLSPLLLKIASFSHKRRIDSSLACSCVAFKADWSLMLYVQGCIPWPHVLIWRDEARRFLHSRSGTHSLMSVDSAAFWDLSSTITSTSSGSQTLMPLYTTLHQMGLPSIETQPVNLHLSNWRYCSPKPLLCVAFHDFARQLSISSAIRCQHHWTQCSFGAGWPCHSLRQSCPVLCYPSTAYSRGCAGTGLCPQEIPTGTTKDKSTATCGLLGWHVTRCCTSLSGMLHMSRCKATSSVKSTAHQHYHWPSVGDSRSCHPATFSVLPQQTNLSVAFLVKKASAWY